MSHLPADFVERQKNAQFSAPNADLSGKTAIVTGSNVGLGYETVAHLMNMKVSRVIMAVRTLSKGEQARKDLLERVQDFKGTIEIWELDMARFASVKAFAAKCQKEIDSLDIAILNAGIATGEWNMTADGWEETIQVNDIATGLLALLLLPLLEKTAKKSGSSFKPHLCIVSSEVHEWAKFAAQDAPKILEALNDQSKHDKGDRYQESKLIDVFMTRELAALPAASQVAVNTANPGLCKSELSRNMPQEMRDRLYEIAWTSEKGARNFAYAAVAENVPSGGYIQMAAPAEPSDYVKSEKGQKVQKKLWEELKAVWVELAPEVKSILA